MNNLDTIKQVTSIEYVRPYQIQTTSSLSFNFTEHIDDKDIGHTTINTILPNIDSTQYASIEK